MKSNIILTLQVFATLVFAFRMGVFIATGAAIQEAAITIIILLVFISSTMASLKEYLKR